MRPRQHLERVGTGRRLRTSRPSSRLNSRLGAPLEAPGLLLLPVMPSRRARAAELLLVWSLLCAAWLSNRAIVLLPQRQGVQAWHGDSKARATL